MTNTLKCLNALQVTINRTLALLNQLQSKDGLWRFLYTRRVIPSAGGNALNSTPVQFCRAFQKLVYKTMLKQSSCNCTEDDDKILVPLRSAAEKKKTTAKEPHQHLSHSSSRSRTFASWLGQMHHSSSYVAGYLAAQALKNHQCSACKESLVNPNLDSSCQRLRHLLDWQCQTTNLFHILPKLFKFFPKSCAVKKWPKIW